MCYSSVHCNCCIMIIMFYCFSSGSPKYSASVLNSLSELPERGSCFLSSISFHLVKLFRSPLPYLSHQAFERMGRAAPPTSFTKPRSLRAGTPQPSLPHPHTHSVLSLTEALPPMLFLTQCPRKLW